MGKETEMEIVPEMKRMIRESNHLMLRQRKVVGATKTMRKQHASVVGINPVEYGNAPRRIRLRPKNGTNQSTHLRQKIPR